MDEKETQQPEKSGLDEKRKGALLRYIAVLFAVAFVLVLVSLLGQARHSKITISELNQSSISALEKAEQLQKDNQSLYESNSALQQDKKYLQQQVEQLTQLLEQAEDTALELKKAREENTLLLDAYESLFAALEAEVPEEDLLKKVEQYKEIFGEKGLHAYESLLKEGE